MDAALLACSGPGLLRSITGRLGGGSVHPKTAHITPHASTTNLLLPASGNIRCRKRLEACNPKRRSVEVRAGDASGVSVSAKSTSTEKIQESLKNVTESFVALDGDFLKRLPTDLQVDLKDAAFDLSSKAVAAECGEEAGAALLSLGTALEAKDVAMCLQAVKGLSAAIDATTPGSGSRAALGSRLKKAARRFASMGAYGKGETQRIAKALDAAGSAVAEGCVESSSTGSEVTPSSRIFKFGTLQLEITASNAFIGAAIALAFGVLSWSLTSSLQSTTEDSLQYANDSALALALSLRGTLLAAGYSCTVLSFVSAIGLVSLALQLNGQTEEAK